MLHHFVKKVFTYSMKSHCLKQLQNRGGMADEARASRLKESNGNEPVRGNAGNAAVSAKAREVRDHIFLEVHPTYSEC